MKKLKNLKCDKTQNFTKLNNSEKTKQKNLNVRNLKKIFVTKLIRLNWEKNTHNLKLSEQIKISSYIYISKMSVNTVK